MPSDGEFGKTMWTQYVVERLGGIERRDLPPGTPVVPNSKDRQDFAEFYAIYNPISVTMWLDPVVLQHLNGAELQPPGAGCAASRLSTRAGPRSSATSPIFGARYTAHQVTEGFLPLAAPASVEASVPNEYYPSDEAYVYALADALREEYLQVVEAGLLLQVDDAFIPYNYDRMMLQGVSMEEYRKHCEMRIDAVELRAARHSGGSRPLPYLLGLVGRTSHQRRATPGHCRPGAPRERAGVFG